MGHVALLWVRDGGGQVGLGPRHDYHLALPNGRLSFGRCTVVAHNFYTAEDPTTQDWGKISIAIISTSCFVNLLYFWVIIDIINASAGDNESVPWSVKCSMRVWSVNLAHNVLIGFMLTALNVRAQAMAAIMLWKVFVHGQTKKSLRNGIHGGGGMGAEACTNGLVIVKLFEFCTETIPELLLQAYALMYRHYVYGDSLMDGNAVLITSISISFATLISGLSVSSLATNTTALMVIGTAYFVSIVFGRMALFVLLFLQFGQLAIAFASASLLLRIVYVVRGHDCVRGAPRLEDSGGRFFRNLMDPPTLVIVPVGHDSRRTAAGGNGADTDLYLVRILGTFATRRAKEVLYGPDALWSVAMHVIEAAIGAVLLYTCGGRPVTPYHVAGPNTGSDPGDSGGAGGIAVPADVELLVEPRHILWYVVWPYCVGLAVLAVLVAVDTTWPQEAPDALQAQQDGYTKHQDELSAAQVDGVEKDLAIRLHLTPFRSSAV